MHTAKIEADKIIIKLGFGDDFREKLAAIQALPDRRWNADRKLWIVPANLVGAVEEIIEQEVEGKAALKKAEAQDEGRKAEIVASLAGTKLFRYQKEGVAYLCQKNRALLADDMGLGKSCQAISMLKMQPEKLPALIVCPASLKVNWQREVKMWADMPAAIVSGSKWQVTKEAKVVIVNYDILGKHIANIKASQFNTLIIDESHYCKNVKTNRYKAVKACAAGIPNFVAMSGTPIENRPSEFFSTLNLIDPDRFGSFWRFAQRYCDAKHNGFGWDFSGSSNPDELHELLNGNVMLRRKKEDVLTELPPKQRFSVPFDLPHQILMPNNISYTPAIEQLNWLKQATARAKIEQAIEWLENMIESGNKIIAFAIHHEIVDAVMKRFKDVAVKLDGRDSQDQRNAAVDRFQNDETIRLFVGNIQAAGVGITLTKATHVVFLELDWKPGSHVQAEDRAHRIGQQESVTCWYLVAADTIEEDIFDMLYKKKQVIDTVLDGGVSESESIIGALAKKYCGGKK